ncbi:hypothetical protein KRMM14A1004_24250 [Krasilnikovia sp. MM14-A1004]
MVSSAWGIMFGVGKRSLEQQYVLHAAATSSLLQELLQHWQPWLPDLEWPDMAVHVPRLAQAIVELVEEGLVEVVLGPIDSQKGLVPTADVPAIVRDPGSWYSEEDGTPVVELVLAEGAGLVDVPPRRGWRSCPEQGHLRPGRS